MKPMTPAQTTVFWKQYPGIRAWALRTGAARVAAKAQRRADNEAEIARYNAKLARKTL